jgi:hypothetical protein
MISAIKERAAKFILNKSRAKEQFSQRNFTGIFDKVYSFLVLMPADDKDFRLSFPALDYLKEQKKTVFVMTNEFRISLLPAYFKTNSIGHGIKDATKLNLPAKNILNKLEKMRFDVIMNLNRKDSVFYSYIAKTISAQVKIGFVSSESDSYFNLQVANYQGDPEVSYNNLLNCLKMF